MNAKTTEQLISELLDQRNIFEDALRKIRDTTWCLCKSGKDCPHCLAKNALDLAYQAKVVAKEPTTYILIPDGIDPQIARDQAAKAGAKVVWTGDVIDGESPFRN